MFCTTGKFPDLPFGRLPHHQLMPVIEVIGAVGGVGASTVAWALARAGRGFAFDLALRPGGLAWATGSTDPRRGSWPQLVAVDLAAEQWLAVAAKTEGARWFSGGDPPGSTALGRLVELAQTTRLVVVDGALGPARPSASVRLGCASNSLRVWEVARKAEFDAMFMRLDSDGIPLAQLRAELNVPVFAVKSEAAVAQASSLGLGVPTNSRLSRECGAIIEWLRARDG